MPGTDEHLTERRGVSTNLISDFRTHQGLGNGCGLKNSSFPMLRSDPSEVFGHRYMPLVLFFRLVTFFLWKVGFRSVQLFFLVPLFLLSLFHLSLAKVEVSAEAFVIAGRQGVERYASRKFRAAVFLWCEWRLATSTSSVFCHHGASCTSYWMTPIHRA